MQNTKTSAPTSRFSVTIVGFDQALSSAITGALDMFALAGISWQRIQQEPATPLFDVQLASLHRQPFQCINQLTLQPTVALEDIKHSDIVLIPTIGGQIESVLEHNQALTPYLRRLYDNGADLAANCTGTFLIAQAGLLNERLATTHWGYADQFRQRFPQVNLQVDKMITHQDRVFCAGGGSAWFDLTLLLIERYCGHRVAIDTAKAHVVDATRVNQSAYASSRQRKQHQDAEVLAAQQYIEQQLSQPLSLEHLATRSNMTLRTFLRRFKRATNQTPGQYIQSVRIAQACKLLEAGNNPIDAIIAQVGYEDASSFTRLFKRHTGLSPSQYRDKFQRRVW